MMFVCVYLTFKQWLNRIGRKLAVLSLNTVHKIKRSRKIKHSLKIGGVLTLETLTFRMYDPPLPSYITMGKPKNYLCKIPLIFIVMPSVDIKASVQQVF